MAEESLSPNVAYREEDESAITALFEDLDGFMVSQTLMAAIEIGLFPLLEDGALSSDGIVDKLGLHEQQGKTFLNICSKFDYLTRVGDTYSLSRQGEVLLRNYHRFQAYVDNRSYIYRDLANLSHLVRTGINDSESMDAWPFKKDEGDLMALPREAIESYSQFMDATSRFWSLLFLDAVDLSGFSALLDIGGGAGGLTIEVAKRYPHMRVGVLDLPSVGSLAEANIQASGLNGWVQFHGGDFLNYPLPESYDAMTLMRVCLDWQDPDLSRILSGVYSGLPSGGRVMVLEPMYTGDREDDRERAKNALRGMLVSNKIRSTEEMSAMISEAGFQDVKAVDTSVSIFKIIQGSKA